MDHAPLDLCLRVNRPDRLFEAWQPVHTEEQDILYPAVFQVIEHPEPELAGLVRPTVMLRISLCLSTVTPRTI